MRWKRHKKGIEWLARCQRYIQKSKTTHASRVSNQGASENMWRNPIPPVSAQDTAKVRIALERTRITAALKRPRARFRASWRRRSPVVRKEVSQKGKRPSAAQSAAS